MSDNNEVPGQPALGGGSFAARLRLPLQLAVVLVVLMAISLSVGAVGLPLGDIIGGLVGGADEPANVIIQEIRLPRTLLACVVGATLGLAGAALQGLLRSPLASPFVLGAPVAAALFAVVAVAVGLAGAASTGLSFAAILGAVTSVGLLVLVAGPRASLIVLVLAGLAVTTLAATGTALAITLAPERFSTAEISFWLLGSLEARSASHLWLVLPFLAASWALLFWDRVAYRALALGEEAAESLGIDLRLVRLRVVSGVAIGVGASVAVTGAIGFVGLVAPQLVRPLVGHDPARLLIPAALAGAALLVAADIIARLASSAGEINVGVVTALIGVPIFILLLLRQRRVLVGAPT